MAVKIHIKEQPETFKRFGAQWTPTILIMAPDGEEAHRIEGFLPVEDFLAQLELGLGKALLRGEKYQDAEKLKKLFPASEWTRKGVVWAG